MKYYSTNGATPQVSLKEAVIRGLAPDRGLYMPETIPQLPKEFFQNISKLSLQEIAYAAALPIFGQDIEPETLKSLIYESLNFDIPLVHVDGEINSLELFHGPTAAFKDVGARFMARVLAYFCRQDSDETVNVLVATSGDTGSAVANGFLGVAGVRVFVLYPKGKVSKIQEAQFTTLGQNITALEVSGTFDDCQRLVKQAFLDAELNKAMRLSSANSINVARFLPQMFYYYYAYAQLSAQCQELGKDLVVAVPSGNFGNITAGLIAKRMGLPVKRFIAANNRNDIFLQYLLTGIYAPRPSVATIANAMDVGEPSNFARVLDLYGKSHKAICAEISGCSYNDRQISETIADVFSRTGYLLDPHGATGYRALQEQLAGGECGVFIETAHPAKFKGTVEAVIGREIEIPDRLMKFLAGSKQTEPMTTDFDAFKKFLHSRI